MVSVSVVNGPFAADHPRENELIAVEQQQLME